MHIFIIDTRILNIVKLLLRPTCALQDGLFCFNNSHLFTLIYHL